MATNEELTEIKNIIARAVEQNPETVKLSKLSRRLLSSRGNWRRSLL